MLISLISDWSSLEVSHATPILASSNTEDSSILSAITSFELSFLLEEDGRSLTTWHENTLTAESASLLQRRFLPQWHLWKILVRRSFFFVHTSPSSRIRLQIRFQKCWAQHSPSSQESSVLQVSPSRPETRWKTISNYSSKTMNTNIINTIKSPVRTCTVFDVT